MDSTHLHLLLNHLPVVGTFFGVGLLLYGYLTRSGSVVQAALITWVLMALAAIPVFLTGEPAEETVENLPGVVESIIESHEEAAELAMWFIEALGIVSLIALFFNKTKAPLQKTMTGIALALSLVTCGLLARTAYLGGQIRHTEIRGGAAAAEAAPVNGAESKAEADDD